MELRRLFGGVWPGTRVLVTGHTGFKGSWLCLWLREMGADVCGLALPPDTTPSHARLLSLDLDEHLVDLRDASAVREAVARTRPSVVFHLAAQPLVRRGYEQPLATFDVNVLGLVHLFEALRACDSVRAVVNATTDKVYREPPPRDGYAEDHPLGGHDPYSASKACAELVSDCYRGSWFASAGVGVATARAGNVIGGGDWAGDRLVPDLVRAAAAHAPLRIRHPDAVRPWQHVLEPLSGYLRLGQALLAGDDVEGAWNFGPAEDATISVAELVARMQAHWPGIEVEATSGAHPREAPLLVLDCGKARRSLGWRPVWDAETSVRRTIDWYRDFHERGMVDSRSDLQAYIAAARGAGLGWAA
ncbi:MAG: CDP-glucose 4,6-dehydratase [Dokdonella sp.]|uniref:CDP-glucose 4,6-dehydratase n=1 Tax=Dokdonella sp. TaxID=2291710 RepID=UPI003F7D57BD